MIRVFPAGPLSLTTSHRSRVVTAGAGLRDRMSRSAFLCRKTTSASRRQPRQILVLTGESDAWFGAPLEIIWLRRGPDQECECGALGHRVLAGPELWSCTVVPIRTVISCKGGSRMRGLAEFSGTFNEAEYALENIDKCASLRCRMLRLNVPAERAVWDKQPFVALSAGEGCRWAAVGCSGG